MSDERKRKHLEKLRQEYAEALARVKNNEGKKLDRYLQKIVKDGCFHPETTTRTCSNDDGYGRWWKYEVETCKLCDKELARKYL